MGKILEKTRDPVVNIALDTINLEKQALVFVNAKRSAEKVAEDISKKRDAKGQELDLLAENILSALQKPTKQCERLAKCIKKGVAFHHSGLASKQKDIVEKAFKDGTVKIISCTPTLAAGMDLPAFRAIIRDVKRFSQHGYVGIPVLEFLQMAGRAGRPRYDEWGEAIVITSTDSERDVIVDKYINGEPEDIYSKLAVEPVLRVYVLSLIVSRIIHSKESIYDFFSKTFWAYQYKDTSRMENIIDKMLDLLVHWEFLQEVKEGYRATNLGKRVAELYVDPLTAHYLLNGIARASETSLKPFSFLHLVSNTLEMRPLLNIRQKEYDDVQQAAINFEQNLLSLEPSMFEPEYESWLKSIKTASMLLDWVDEKNEDWILEKYNCRPGESKSKIDRADWLLYTCHELARLEGKQPLLKEITKIRLRLKYGVKEELLPLIKLEKIGRVRARKLFMSGFKDLGALRKSPVESLARILGKSVAANVKKQVGSDETTLEQFPKEK